MDALEDYHELSSILAVRIFTGVSNVRFELQVGNLKLKIEIHIRSPAVEVKVSSDELASVRIRALDVEGSTERHSRILVGGFNDNIGLGIVLHYD